MAFAVGAQTQVSLVAQTAFGTIPATPAFTNIRVTKSSLGPNKFQIASEELRADRARSDIMLAGYAASGNLQGELSYASWDDVIAAALMSSWTTNAIANGVTPSFFAIEERVEQGATDTYIRTTGCMVDQLTLDLTPRQAVQINATIKARNQSYGEAAIAGATYAAANTNAIIATPYGVASLTVGSYTLKVAKLSLQIANNLRDRLVVDSPYSEEFGLGQCLVTGSMDVYFQDKALLEAAMAHANAALSATIGTETNKKYTISLPRVVFGEPNLSERNVTSDIMLTVPFEATYDTTATKVIGITRAVA